LRQNGQVSAPVRIGRYRVDRRIGSGSFATVWLAHDEVLDAPVAVKVLADNWAHHLDIRERFLEEARILRRADSDRVVRVHDLGDLEDGRPYFVMTYADRGTLAERLAAGPLPIPLAVQYCADVARGLAVLHAVGVIHRDVNPANVLLCTGRDGIGERVLVADLGLAKAAAHGSGFTLTVGTPGYVAPEQLAGAGLDRRTDVYSVGMLLHHLLTGAAPPTDGARPQAPAELRPEVPAAVDAVVRQATAVRPEDRFPSAVALADALDAASVVLAASRRPAAPGRQLDSGRPSGGGLPTGDRRPTPPAAADRRPAPPTVVGSPPDRRKPASAPAWLDDTVELRRPRRRRRRGRIAALLALVGVVLAGGSAAAVVARSRATATVAVTGAAGQLSVTVPSAWGRQVQDAGWDLTPYGLAGRSGSGLAVAGDISRWRDPTTSSPGVFVGLATGLRIPAVQAAGPRCPYVQEDDRTIAGLPATVRRHQPCAGSAAELVEAVLAPPDGRYIVFVQVKEPAGSDQADRVLDSLTVRPPA
jgi:eukaryotic-like serine/threonine-protein kinase